MNSNPSKYDFLCTNFKEIFDGKTLSRVYNILAPKEIHFGYHLAVKLGESPSPESFLDELSISKGAGKNFKLHIGTFIYKNNIDKALAESVSEIVSGLEADKMRCEDLDEFKDNPEYAYLKRIAFNYDFKELPVTGFFSADKFFDEGFPTNLRFLTRELVAKLNCFAQDYIVDRIIEKLVEEDNAAVKI